MNEYKDYWQIASQWNNDIVQSNYTVHQAIKILSKICVWAPYSSILYKRADQLLDAIINNAEGPIEAKGGKHD